MGIVCVVVFCIAEYFGYIWHTAVFATPYRVKGLDVSNHQGSIDWQQVADTKNYSFVYIKATEGHDFTDDYFQKNWDHAQQYGLRVGAYHFFSKRSSGEEQAQFFISHVPKRDEALPPVVDVEIDTALDSKAVRKELDSFMAIVDRWYGKKTIIYVTYETYEAYIQGYYPDRQLWIRDIFWYPHGLGRQWDMWQYTSRAHVPGIPGYVDINVARD
jgi:lysozyme